MKKKTNILSTILMGACLASFVSCGGDSSSSGSGVPVTPTPGSNAPEEEQQQDDQGIYRAVLNPLNSSVSGSTTGTVEIRIEQDNFSVQANVAGAQGGVKHLQNVMLLNECPTEAQDVNADGVVDILEMLPSTGTILIPLDSDLSNQLDGVDFGPISNGAGTYVYRRSTSYTELMTDLMAVDPDPVDPYAKMAPGQNLSLDGRVVVIHGVRSSTNLPDTTGTIGDANAATLLPIACGTLTRVTAEEAPTTDTIETVSTGESRN